jgi:hypothetical protein
MIVHLVNASHDSTVVGVVAWRSFIPCVWGGPFAESATAGFHQISVDTRRNVEEHVGIIFRFNLGQLLIMLAPE